MLLFIFACVVANVMGNASPTLYHYPMHLALSHQPCVRSLYENQDVSDDKTYSELKNGMQEAIADVYHTAYNSSFYKVTIAKFFCESVTEVSIEFNIALTFKDSTSNVSQTLEDILATDARFSNKTSGKSVLVGPLNKVNSPVTYNVLETEIVNNVLCKQIHMETFRNNLAKKLIVVDSNGLSSARASQIVLADHQCGDASLRFKNAKLHFFVSKSGNVFSPHKDLTELSFKVLEQMIYDGSTWKLGLALDKRVSDISLKGGDDSDKMSDVEIIYLGIGIVIILLLLIVGIIMLLKCCGCCKDDKNRKPNKKLAEDKHDYAASANNNVNKRTGAEMQEIAAMGSKGMTNAAYEPAGAEVKVDIDMKPVSKKVHSDTPAGVMDTRILVNDNDVKIETVEEKSLLDEVVEGMKQDQSNGRVLVTNDVVAEPTQENSLKEIPDAVMLKVEPLPKNDTELKKPINANKGDSSSSSSDSEEEEIDDGDDLDYRALKAKQGDYPALEKEYKSIERRMPTGLIYSDEAALKNRNPSQFPWPDKRVSLKTIDGNPDSDYINASLVKGFDGKIAYISTQAPMLKTVDDFWRMVWEQSVEIIVMATCVTSRGQERCAQYWPNDSVSRAFGDVSVKLKKKDLKPDYVVTTLTASDSLGASRDVTIYRYMSWPTRDTRETPDSVKSVVAFLLEVKERIDATKALPVFHGSNSVGMGTVFLTIVQGITRYEAQKHVNIKKMVRLLRKGQAGAIENFEQYKFIYDAISLYEDYAEN